MTDVATTAPPLTALVTGATAGLGKEIALRLAQDGMRVVVVDRDAARGAAVVEQIEARVARLGSSPPTSATRPRSSVWPSRPATSTCW